MMLFVNLCTVSLLALALQGIHCRSLRSANCQKRVSHDGGFVFPGTQVEKCPTQDMTCVAKDKCPNALAEDQVPTICDWEGDTPLICCPSQGTRPPPQVTRHKFNNLRTQPQTAFPQEDCAKSGVTPAPASGASVVADGESKIFVVGGETVDTIDTYPFMVAIIQVLGSGREFLCGGSLLSRTVVLTAAHCFLNMDSSSKYIVRLGSTNFLADQTESNEFAVTSVTLHPGFKFPQLYHDVALLKIAGLTSYSNTQRPICLMDKAEDEKSSSPITIMGWGTTSSGGRHSKFLQEASINVTVNSECNAILSRLGVLPANYPKGITNEVLCAGNTNNISRDACQGDSGGPAVVLVDGIWRQRGIVSTGIGCGIKGIPGLYARVSEYTDWITQNA